MSETSTFGVPGEQSAHDASAFYARFPPVHVCDEDDGLTAPKYVDRIYSFDAREMFKPLIWDNEPEPDPVYVPPVRASSVALVVTSPPYYAGKDYETALGEGHVPATYSEHLRMLRDVFNECCRALESGGRIAVNIANLGRKPFRSQASDVIRILQDDLGLLLRGEIIWRKAAGASGNARFGSWRMASNPVLRDTTERIIVASKGRFSRAVHWKQRQGLGLPWESTISAENFLRDTLDVWDIRPESAKRVGHPAPFPVELPQRLIDLYTYRRDLVMDPFMGSGTTAVAALLAGRYYVGFETEPEYVTLADQRIAKVLEELGTDTWERRSTYETTEEE